MFKIIFLFFVTQNAFAEKVEKIGGLFIVQKISSLKSGDFKVVFRAKEKSGQNVTSIELLTDHIHPGIAEGLEMKISAEVDSIKNHVAYARQILVFVPSKTGANPVWLVARNRNFSPPDADFLKMHAPSNDYLIL